MDDFVSFLIGNAESITDIEFLARLVVFIMIIYLFCSIASILAGVSK